MTTKPPSAKRSARSTKAPKRTALGLRLEAAAKEIARYRRGEIALETYEIRVPDQIDVAELRRRLGLTQRLFAARFGLDVTAIHAWEQGRRRPDRAARVLLAVIAKEPEAVRRALAG